MAATQTKRSMPHQGEYLTFKISLFTYCICFCFSSISIYSFSPSFSVPSFILLESRCLKRSVILGIDSPVLHAKNQLFLHYSSAAEGNFYVQSFARAKVSMIEIINHKSGILPRHTDRTATKGRMSCLVLCH